MTAPQRRITLLVMAAILLTVGGIAAAKTPAGTVISNQAVVTFKDLNNVERTVLSNIVYVTVQQVYGVEVSPKDAQGRNLVAGQTV